MNDATKGAVLANRPGQPALEYRPGTHATFLSRMLAELSKGAGAGGPSLAGLTTRAPDDFAIALLDAWAAVADVLTFYQERIVNEGFLRTATERRSVLELARAIGYELGPGVAASALLAFTTEETADAPDVVTVPRGTRVQSIPSAGEPQQTFETADQLEARPEWNTLRPRLTRPQTLAIDDGTLVLVDPDGERTQTRQLYLAGTATNLKGGDFLLVALPSDGADAPDSALAALPFPIRRAIAEPALGRTRVDLGAVAPRPPFKPPRLPLGSFDRRPLPFRADTIAANVLDRTWRERDLSAFLAINRWSAKDLLKHVASRPTSRPLRPEQGVFAFRSRVGFFGHNAPRWETLPSSANTRGGAADDPFPQGWDGQRARTIWTDSQGRGYRTNEATSADVYLERGMPEVEEGSWALFTATTPAGPLRQAYRVEEVSEASLVDYGISGKVTGLRLRDPDGDDPPEKPEAFRVRATTAYVQSGRLALSELPIDEPIEQGTTSLTLDRMVLGLQVGQQIVVSGELVEAAGAVRHEVVSLSDVDHVGGYTTLHFDRGLADSYVRESVTLRANTVPATHGETIDEVLGSGDSARPGQRFRLRKPPLTYVPAATASGAASTLQVRVDDVLWQEVPSLHGQGADSQSYMVRFDDDGNATVVFGDGQHGARLPTGQENVTATYRSGTGPAGEVRAGGLTLLPTRPPGVREVTNSRAADGAAPPERLESARSNAPLSVRTLGRAVSLRDFAELAGRFAGVGKAHAVALWDGKTRLVHVTVAGIGGGEIDPDSDLVRNLRRALVDVGDGSQTVRVDGHQPGLFHLAAKVLVDPRHRAGTVLGAVERALQAAFSFETRRFGQPVTAAEVITVIQRVPGVVATDLDLLHRAGDPAVLQQVMLAAPARLEGGEIQPAELLLLNPAGVSLTEMSA